MRLLTRTSANYDEFHMNILEKLLRSVPVEERKDFGQLRLVVPALTRKAYCTALAARIGTDPDLLVALIAQPNYSGVPILEGPPELDHLEIYTTKGEES